MGDALPTWLVKAVEAAGPRDHWSLDCAQAVPGAVGPAPGDIYLVDFMLQGETADPLPAMHCLVLRPQGTEPASSMGPSRFLIMALTGNVAASVDTDMLLLPAETGVPYTLLARTDLVGPVFACQLCRRIGQIAPDLMSVLRAESIEGPHVIPLERRGLPVRSAIDSRVAAKHVEAASFLRLTGECRDSHIATEPVTVDLASFDNADPELFRHLADRRVVLPPKSPDPDAAVLTGLGLCVDARSVFAAAREHALSISGPSPAPRRARWVPGRSAVDAALNDFVGGLAQSGVRSCRVIEKSREGQLHRVVVDGQHAIQVIAEASHVTV